MHKGFVTDKSSYVKDKLLNEFKLREKNWTLSEAYDKTADQLQWADYDDLDWDRILAGDLVANAFILRKGLIRKAQLAWYLRKYYTKKEGSILAKAVPDTIILELDQRSLHCAAMYDVKDALQEEGKKWILKPSVVDKAIAVELIQNYKHLKSVLRANEDILEWVFQEYIPRPLLVEGFKFHIRTYVVAVGDLKVYVHRDMLALFALKPFTEDNSAENRLSHITNTCVQQDHPNFDENKSVRALDELESAIGKEGVSKVKSNIYEIVKETFLALIQETSVFMALPNCFELFGFDFIVDSDLNCYILEANAGPDLKNTGNRLDYVIISLLEGIMADAVDTFFPPEPSVKESLKKGNLNLVLDHKGKKWGKSQIKLRD